MSTESTQEVMMRYFNSEHSDISMMADDVVFRDMNSGNEAHGPQGVMQLLNYFYHIAFDATAETTNTIFADGQAVVEGYFVGKHIGDFAGIPPTNKDVRVPLCVIYDLENDQITEARIYLATTVLMQQLGVIPGAE